VEEGLIYREEVTGIVGALADMLVVLREIRDILRAMAKKKIWKSEEIRAWERGFEERLKNLIELAGGRAEREHREKRAREAEAD
jgi:hypothetical protein